MKHSIQIFSLVLICLSCAEDKKRTDEKSVEQIAVDTVKNIEPKQNTTTETTVDPTEEGTKDEFQDTPPAPIVGSWDDVDPADPGPGSQHFVLEANGVCNIYEQEGGYEGTWSYDPANRILNLRITHTDGSGKVDPEVDNDYKIEEMTEDKIEITDLSERYPHLGGSYWRSKN